MVTIQEILIPFHRLTFELEIDKFLLNISLILMMMTNIMQQVDKQWLMIDYILSRTSPTKTMIKLTLNIYIKLIGWMLIPIASGSLGLTLSTWVTLLIWCEMFMILRFKHVNSKTIYFSLLVLMIVAQSLVTFMPSLTIFALGSVALLQQPYFWIGMKIVLWVLLIGSKLQLIKKYESLGGQD